MTISTIFNKSIIFFCINILFFSSVFAFVQDIVSKGRFRDFNITLAIPGFSVPFTLYFCVIGVIVGTAVCSLFADIKGRKAGLLLMSLCFAVVLLLLSIWKPETLLARNVYIWGILRVLWFIVTTALMSIVFVSIMENVKQNKIIFFCGLALALTILGRSLGVGLVLVYEQHWRMVLTVFAGIQAVLLLFAYKYTADYPALFDAKLSPVPPKRYFTTYLMIFWVILLVAVASLFGKYTIIFRKFIWQDMVHSQYFPQWMLVSTYVFVAVAMVFCSIIIKHNYWKKYYNGSLLLLSISSIVLAYANNFIIIVAAFLVYVGALSVLAVNGWAILFYGVHPSRRCFSTAIIGTIVYLTAEYIQRILTTTNILTDILQLNAAYAYLVVMLAVITMLVLYFFKAFNNLFNFNTIS